MRTGRSPRIVVSHFCQGLRESIEHMLGYYSSALIEQMDTAILRWHPLLASLKQHRHEHVDHGAVA
jgi:hypothetical protein